VQASHHEIGHGEWNTTHQHYVDGAQPGDTRVEGFQGVGEGD
jgi:hypothetical protein